MRTSPGPYDAATGWAPARWSLHARLDPDADHGPLMGFVVSKAVGTAVARNRVKRRLRHLVAARLADTPPAARVVVRALPAARTQPQRLADDLDHAWSRIARGWQPGYQPAGSRHGRRNAGPSNGEDAAC
ncbi:ribonuclease P protein component [Microlunatus sp. Gsoil 973]|uniref:ribonuclease P protein component n=1 Tax=Microlunatus sp. Gsoil 973 TaxID=2672569 RepID=UPI001E642B40|nr:ribonuclease P protein component [Microlunatus sp. Gsoil 973]